MPEKEDIIKASDHLFYEIKQLDALAQILVYIRTLDINHGGLENKSQKSIHIEAIKNAVLEAFLMHTRSILDFLFTEESKNKDDVLSLHFLERKEDIKEMKKIRSKIISEKEYHSIKRRINKEIVHLTYYRINIDEIDKRWEYLKIRDIVLRACLVCYKFSNKDLLKTVVNQYLEKHLELYRHEIEGVFNSNEATTYTSATPEIFVAKIKYPRNK